MFYLAVPCRPKILLPNATDSGSVCTGVHGSAGLQGHGPREHHGLQLAAAGRAGPAQDTQRYKLYLQEVLSIF